MQNEPKFLRFPSKNRDLEKKQTQNKPKLQNSQNEPIPFILKEL